LSKADLKQIRQHVEEFNAIDDEMRALIESQWPDLASKLPPRKAPLAANCGAGGVGRLHRQS